MSLQLLTLIYAIVFFTTGAVSGTEVKKAVGDEVSFGPDNPPPPSVSSITWKHIKDGETVKVIEWEDGETIIPNPRFNGITTLDTATGQITITKLTVEHSGVYTIDISGKEQAQRFTLTVMGPEEKKAVGAVGDEVSFRPDKPLPASVSSITWKHIKDGETVKVIEWEDGKTIIPNPRFKDITTLDMKTGQITITNLKVEHSGVYTIDINGKEQEQRFTWTVMEPVPKPEKSAVVYLRCENSDKVIGKDSTREERKCSAFLPTGESITDKKEGNPENFYTCTPGVWTRVA